MQLADRFYRQGVGHWLWIHRPQCLDGMVEGLDAGRDPKLGRCGHRHFRIKNHDLRHDAWVRTHGLDPGLFVSDPGKGSELTGRERSRNSDLWNRVLRPVTQELQRRNFRRINWTTAAEADDEIGLGFTGAHNRFIDRVARNMLLAAAIGADPAVFEQGLQLAHQVSFGGQRLAGEDERPFLAEAVDLFRDLRYRTCAEYDF